MAKLSKFSRRSFVRRTTTFDALPDWLSRKDVVTYTNISLAAADSLIHKLPYRRFGRHLRVSKFFFAPDEVRRG